MRSLLLPLLASAAFATCRGMPATGETPGPLRFGLFVADATGTREQLATRYQPLVMYLEKRLARPIELVVSRAAGDMLTEFEAGRFDVVFHRAIAFPHAHEHAGALPLVTGQEERRATTLFLASASDPRRTLTEFRDARFLFSVRFGSSYVMGRHYLEQRQIALDTFFGDVRYATVADDAIDQLRRGRADVCVVNSQALLRMIASGALRSTEVRIVAETPPHVGELWFASKAMPAEVRMNIRDAFLELATEHPEHAAALKVLGASGYLPASLEDYRQLTELMREMKLLDVEPGEWP
jgi:ABC-type phosphate/phosphonate transport system substrate-binding protein